MSRPTVIRRRSRKSGFADWGRGGSGGVEVVQKNRDRELEVTRTFHGVAGLGGHCGWRWFEKRKSSTGSAMRRLIGCQEI
jgi:hypothetical protein